jgi:MFS family permease
MGPPRRARTSNHRRIRCLLLRIRRFHRAVLGRDGLAGGDPGCGFAGVLVVNGALATFGGRLVDRYGPRPALLIAGTFGAGSMYVASAQSSLPAFAVAYISGCGLVGALAY